MMKPAFRYPFGLLMIALFLTGIIVISDKAREHKAQTVEANPAMQEYAGCLDEFSRLNPLDGELAVIHCQSHLPPAPREASQDCWPTSRDWRRSEYPSNSGPQDGAQAIARRFAAAVCTPAYTP